MTTLGKAGIVATTLLLAIPATAHAGCRFNCGGGTDWGAAVGAGIAGGIIGSALAPAPQPQIIVVPAQPTPPPTIIVVPGYQPPQPQASPTAGRISPVPASSSCIGGAVAAGRLTLVNNCGQTKRIAWGIGDFHREWVAYTETVLPAGASRTWAVSSYHSGDHVSVTACANGLRIIDASTNRKATGNYPGASLECR